MTEALTLAGIDAVYGDSHVLHGVGLTLRDRSLLALLGRNGAGKTTCMGAIMGMVTVRRGSIALFGQTITSLPCERIARLGIGLVPQGRRLFPSLTVAENLTVARHARPGAAWCIDRVFATFPRLAERLDHGGQQLSGGEQQMLSIGRALLTNPLLLILDEATEGLAPLVVAEIWRTVAEIRATGIATLIVDRNARAVLAHTDDAVVLEKGRVVLAGESQRLADDGAALERYLGV